MVTRLGYLSWSQFQLVIVQALGVFVMVTWFGCAMKPGQSVGYIPWVCLSGLQALGVFVVKPGWLVTGLVYVCHGYMLWVCLLWSQVSQLVTSLGCASVCLAVTCHLHFWPNDQDLLHVTAVAWGGTDTEIRFNKESWPWRRKVSCSSFRDSNLQPFNHESGTKPLSFPCPCHTAASAVKMWAFLCCWCCFSWHHCSIPPPSPTII